MTPIDVLDLALAKERNSIKFYRNMAERYPEIKELAYALLNEEEKHEKMISDKMTELLNS